MQHNLKAPQVNRYFDWLSRQSYRHVGFAFSYDEESYRILDQIFALIKQIKPVSKNGVRELWFRAERGTISDFGSFEEYQDMEKLTPMRNLRTFGKPSTRTRSPGIGFRL